jgi:PhnB protein
MYVSPYLNFNGTCREAFTFYETCFRGKLVAMLAHGETPMADQMPEMKDSIVHARLIVGNTALMGSDCPPEYFHATQGITVSMVIDTAEEADRIFAELSEGGAVRMPIEETFWAVRFGMVTDKFGIPWMINCEKPMNA